MAQQRVITGLAVVLAFVCVTNAAFAQTQATTTNGTQTVRGVRISLPPHMAQEASNPFASSWLMQLQQNNNWTEMPRGDDHTRVQSNLQFQPLLSLRLTEKQGLIIRPSRDDRQFRSPSRSERADMNGPTGSATPFSDLRCRVRSSAAGSWSAQARRSSSRRRRRICSARTHGRWGLMREPRCSARTSSPTASCSNGSRSAETAGTRTR